MSFTVKARCKFGEIVHRRGTAEAALRKAKELSRSQCYDIHIVTPEGRDYDSSEFGIFPARRWLCALLRKATPIHRAV
ncbi:hypothetical protein BE61_50780 [Bradyrhizobium elkanii USDA 61]|jgi:hypothetical protein|nr:hypothetical protein BE61_50780 [Bradyrhizobium elkanii USDA 61]GEC53260.1 hypothetical protein BEL01nite_23030 [Bradyrhizobium elkanii]